MKPRRIAVLTLTGVALAAAGGGAIAATQDDPEQSILNDAAGRLNVTPKENARPARARRPRTPLDRAVKAGKLTQEQADAIKQRRAADGGLTSSARPAPRRSARLPRPSSDHGGPPPGDRAAATRLGLTERSCASSSCPASRWPTSPRRRARPVDGLKAADQRRRSRPGSTRRSRTSSLTQARADEFLKRFDERFDQFAQRSRPAGGHHRGFGAGHPWNGAGDLVRALGAAPCDLSPPARARRATAAARPPACGSAPEA